MQVKQKQGRRLRSNLENSDIDSLRALAQCPLSEQYISPNEAGRLLGLTGEAVKQWVYHRQLPAVKLCNGYWKIKIADLEEFVKSRMNNPLRKLLIIDTPGPELEEMKRAVESLNYEAVAAHTFADALLKASDIYPSLFIANVSTPQIDSWELLKRFRKTRNIKTLPILIVSDRDLDMAATERALAVGAQGFLRRPIEARAAAEEIRKVLNRIL